MVLASLPLWPFTNELAGALEHMLCELHNETLDRQEFAWLDAAPCSSTWRLRGSLLRTAGVDYRMGMDRLVGMVSALTRCTW